MITTCTQHGKYCTSGKTTINSRRPYNMMGTYMTHKLTKVRLGIHVHYNEYTNIIVNIVVNNVVLIKQQ